MHSEIEIRKGDITTLKVDAIVNAANVTLLGGGGVDGAIHKAAGKELLEECKTLNGCEVGEAKLTKAYQLPSKYVIHTVGPVWKGGDSMEKEKLQNCYINSMQIANNLKLKSIAFPNISTGVYGYPKPEACKIAMRTVMAYIAEFQPNIKVVFVIFDDENFKLYQKLLNL